MERQPEIAINQDSYGVKLVTLLRAVRPLNLFIVVLTQLVCYYLFDYSLFTGLSRFLLITATTVCAAAAGNLVNDIFDIVPDSVNKPGRVWVNTKLSFKVAWEIYFTLALLACLFAILFSLRLFLLVIIIQAGLWFYSRRLSHIAVVGNIAVSLFTGLVILIIPLAFSIYDEGQLVLGLFAFLLNLYREIVKDIQDMPGDEIAGRKTLPLLVKPKIILLVMAVLAIFPALALDWLLVELWRYRGAEFWAMVLFFILPLHLLPAFLIAAARNSLYVKRSSTLLKLLMLGGLLFLLVSIYLNR